MLFQRREKQPIQQKVRNFVWPTMGLRRLFDYYRHRSIRIPASDHSIAAGLAIGCFVSWTPLFGTHLIQCLILCWISRTNVIAAFIGTVFGNLLTTPALMFIAYQAGKIVLSLLGYDHLIEPHAADGASELSEHSLRAPRVFLPTLIGGYTVGILTFPLFYYPFLYMVKAARATRRARIQKKVHDHARDITGQAE